MNARPVTRLLFLLAVSCVCGGAVPLTAQGQSSKRRASAHPSKLLSSSSPAAHPAPPVGPVEMRGDEFMARKMYHKAIDTYQDLLLSRGVRADQPVRKKGFFARLFGIFGGGGERMRQDPENARLLDKIGIAYQELGDINQSENSYKRSAEANKHFASPLNNLGTVEFGRKRYKNAVMWYKKAVKVDPTMATTFSNMGYAYLAWNKYPEAILSFRQAILLDPGIFRNRGGQGPVVEDSGGANPGLYYYTLAKTFAMLGNADRCAHFLEMSRDEGYKKFTDALKDPAFRSVLKDPRVMAILSPPTHAGPAPTN